MEKTFYLLIVAFILQNQITCSRQHEQKLSFMAIGDIGGIPIAPYSTYTQKIIAKQMGKLANQTKTKFIIGLGDNFYYNGVKTVTDPRFHQTFESVYKHTSLKHPHCRWYMIAGNHDYKGNVSAQIAYSKKSERWHFPNYYYTRIEKIPHTNMKVQLVMIDTTLLCNLAGKHKNHEPTASEQMTWIENTLKNCTADYLIVAGHHPILSAGAHGPTSNARMQKLKALLEKYNATVYLSGHDHNIQYIKEEDSNVHYVISGSGNFKNRRLDNKFKVPQGSLKYFHGSTGGFAYFEAKPKKLRLHTMINQVGWGLVQSFTQRILPRAVKPVKPVLNHSYKNKQLNELSNDESTHED